MTAEDWLLVIALCLVVVAIAYALGARRGSAEATPRRPDEGKGDAGESKRPKSKSSAPPPKKEEEAPAAKPAKEKADEPAKVEEPQ